MVVLRPAQTTARERATRSLTLAAVLVGLASCSSVPTAQEANEGVLILRQYENWAWALGIGLIWADLVLPVPQTAVIAALGIVYGAVLGGLLGCAEA
jgi:uncharacterized membrane protein YdjX (TVP38/TMEM64 family)